jgi:hypothetical protein
VDVAKHQAFNYLFGGSATPHQISEELNTRWIDPDYRLEVVLAD